MNNVDETKLKSCIDSCKFARNKQYCIESCIIFERYLDCIGKARMNDIFVNNGKYHQSICDLEYNEQVIGVKEKYKK